TATKHGIFIGACGGSQNNDLVSKNNVTKVMSHTYFIGNFWTKYAGGIQLKECGPGAPHIQGTTITWNTLTDWTMPPGSAPIKTDGAPGTLVSLNTIVG